VGPRAGLDMVVMLEWTDTKMKLNSPMTFGVDLQHQISSKSIR